MAANCEGSAPRPCEHCGPCQLVLAGNHPDVWMVEPDPSKATPVISVDQVREVVRKVGFHRFSGKRRTVIVDPAESLGPGAANALLKTLEEPPEGTGFILISHRSSALLPTIISRCQRIRFATVPPDEILGWLESMGTGDADALSRACGGAPGRALALAESGLDSRQERRERLVAALRGSLADLFKFSASTCSGSRREWLPELKATREMVEELLRDASLVATGTGVSLVHADRRDLVDEWARKLWPTGVRRVQQALHELDKGLAVNVGGKNALDQLLTTLREELGYA